MLPTNVKKKVSTAGFSLVELVVSIALSAVVFAAILSGFTFLGRNLTRLVNSRDQDSKGRTAVHLFSQDVSGAIQISDATSSKITVMLPATPPAGIRTGRIDSTGANILGSASAGWTSSLAKPAVPWRVRHTSGGAILEQAAAPADPVAPWLVRITSGRSNGRLLTIAANTATTLTLIEIDPASPDEFRGVDLSTLGLVEGTDTFELVNAVTYTYLPPAPESPATGTLTRTDGIKSLDVCTNLSSLAFSYYNQTGALLTLATGEADLAKSGIQSVKEIELSFASAVGNSESGTQSVFAAKSPRLVLRNRPLLQ